jgi:hypothetical protein
MCVCVTARNSCKVLFFILHVSYSLGRGEFAVKFWDIIAVLSVDTAVQSDCQNTCQLATVSKFGLWCIFQIIVSPHKRDMCLLQNAVYACRRVSRPLQEKSVFLQRALFVRLIYFSLLFGRIARVPHQTEILWRIDPLLRSDCVNNSRCYEAPAAYACAVTLHDMEWWMQAVFCVGPLRGYMDRSTVFCWANECSAVEGSPVEC